jgi:hypothetical protein
LANPKNLTKPRAPPAPARAPTQQPWPQTLPDILAALEALGRARRLDDGRWMG